MFKRILVSIAALAFVGAALSAPGIAESGTPKPVYILLYSRFYDHSHPSLLNERLTRLLRSMEALRNKFPDSNISTLLEFSGTTSQLLDEQNSSTHLLDAVKNARSRGLVDIGYTGEDEPSYLHRPHANVLALDTPEQRWTAKCQAIDKFLKDYKNPVTGDPFPGLSGGLKRMQEVFGPAAFIAGANPDRFGQAGDSYVSYEVRKMNQTAVMTGIGAPDPRRDIEGFGVSAQTFSKGISPSEDDSPEVYWADGFLRLSEASLPDNRARHTTDEGAESVKKAFEKLDRSKVRVIRLEVNSYLRYFVKRSDGSVRWDPMEWLYYHPDDPEMPVNLKALLTPTQIDAAYKQEEQTLNWILGEFLPANPGSRVISVRDLSRMAEGSGDPQARIDADELKSAAEDLEKQFSLRPMQAPPFAKGGSRYYSLAETFSLLVEALAATEKNGSAPQFVMLRPVWGPIEIANIHTGPIVASFSPEQVRQAAAKIAPALAKTEMTTVPSNAVPLWVTVGDQKINAGQFLRLMAQTYLHRERDGALKINSMTMFSDLFFMLPKNTPMVDQGLAWTIKPANLDLEALHPATASR